MFLFGLERNTLTSVARVDEMTQQDEVAALDPLVLGHGLVEDEVNEVSRLRFGCGEKTRS